MLKFLEKIFLKEIVKLFDKWIKEDWLRKLTVSRAKFIARLDTFETSGGMITVE